MFVEHTAQHGFDSSESDIGPWLHCSYVKHMFRVVLNYYYAGGGYCDLAIGGAGLQ